jgi:DNA-directed RNA polymerase specialized sigma24 family protein
MYSQVFQRAENGDSQAQAELFRQHYPATYRLAYSLLHHREDAEEVAQDALAYALFGKVRAKRPRPRRTSMRPV